MVLKILSNAEKTEEKTNDFIKMYTYLMRFLSCNTYILKYNDRIWHRMFIVIYIIYIHSRFVIETERRFYWFHVD